MFSEICGKTLINVPDNPTSPSTLFTLPLRHLLSITTRLTRDALLRAPARLAFFNRNAQGRHSYVANEHALCVWKKMEWAMLLG